MARNKHPEVTEERILDVAQQLLPGKGVREYHQSRTSWTVWGA